MRCLLSPLAERDLEEIGDYIARDAPLRAISFIREVRERCARIASAPLAAPLRPELGEGVRMVVFRNYLIFYRAESDCLRIERILHGARDVQDLDSI